MKTKLLSFKLLLLVALSFFSSNAYGQIEATHTFSATTGTIVSGTITYTTDKNAGTNPPAFNSGDSTLRLYYSGASPYNGNSITINPTAGVTITGIELYGVSNQTPVLRYTIGNATASATDPLINLSGTTYTVTGLNVVSGSSIKIRNANTSNTHARLTGIKVTYIPANAAPTATNVDITGSMITGSQLTGSYTYNDAEANAEGTSTFKWYRANDVNGTGAIAIAGATAKTYTLTTNDLGKYIRFGVVPVAITGTSPGVEAFSTWKGAVSSNFAITAVSNNNNYGTVSLAGNVVTATPVVGYTYGTPAYNVTSGTATVVQNGNQFTITPSSDTTVQINFVAKPNYTLTLMNDGRAYNNGGFPIITYEGNTVTLPILADCGGYSFVGWSENASTTSAPTYLGGATYTTTSSNVTLYAVYSNTVGGTESSIYGFEDGEIGWTSTATKINTNPKTGTYSGRINTNDTYTTYETKVVAPLSISFSLMKTSTNNNYDVQVQTSTDKSNWTTRATYPMSDFANGSYTEKVTDLSSYQNVFVRIYVRNTTATRHIDDINLVYSNAIATYTTTPNCNPATLNVSTTTLTDFNYSFGNGPSVAKSFVLSGQNLDNTAVTVLADGAKFEVSENETTGFTDEITLATYTGSNKTIWVRAKAGQQVGQINDIVLVSGGGATEDKEVNVSGEIVSIAPTLSVSTDEINDLGYILGASTSISKLVSITGMNLDGSKDVLIGMEQGSLSNFEISLAEDGTYGPDLFVENYDGSALNVYVRLKTGMPIVNNYEDILDITTDYTGIDDLGVLVYGAVTTPIIITDPQELTPFSTNVGATDSKDIAISGSLSTDVATEITGADAVYFSVSPNSVTAAGGTITISYHPTQPGNHTTILKLSTNGGVTKELTLTGNAVVAAPVAIDATNITGTSFVANWNPVPNATSYKVNVYKELREDEGVEVENFDGVIPNENYVGEDSVFKEGWEYSSTGNRQIYTSANNYGVGAPSYAFTTTGDYVKTKQYVGKVLKLSFWAKNQGGTTSSTLIQGFNGISWIDIATLPNNDTTISTSTGGTVTYDLQTLGIDNVHQVRMVFNKTAGNLSIDDITVEYQNVVKTPIAGSPFTVAAPATSANITGLEADTDYFYTVEALMDTYSSTASNEIAVSTADKVIWDGTAWNNGVGPNAQVNAEIAGVYNVTTDFVAKDLSVTTGGLVIQPGHSVTVHGALSQSADDLITVESDASLLQVEGSTHDGKTITVKRYAHVPANQYNLWSSPVVAQDLYALYGAAGPVPTDKVMEYITKTDTFKPMAAGSKSASAKGYSALGLASNDVTAIFNGVPHNGPVSYDAGANTGQGDGYNLIGNPYPSNFDLDKFYSLNKNALDGETVAEPGVNVGDNTAYFWDNTDNVSYGQYGSNYNGDNYAVYNFSSKTGIGAPAFNETGGGKVPTAIIKPGQGFIVKLKKATSSLNFDNTMRTSDTSPVYFKTEAPKRFWLELTTPKQLIISTAVVYNEAAVNTYDKYDTAANTFASDGFYTMTSNAKAVSIQGRQDVNIKDDVVPVGIKAYEAGDYSIRFAKGDNIFADGQDVYLKDNSLNKIVKLTDAGYHFALDKGVNTTRFEIVYQSKTLAVDAVNSQKDIVVYKDADSFVVKARSTAITKVEVYDMLGRLVLVSDKASKEVRIANASLVEGTYVLKISQNNNIVTQKVIK